MALDEWKALVLTDGAIGAWDFQDASLPLASFSTTSYPLTSSASGNTHLHEPGPDPIPYSVRTTGAATRLTNIGFPAASYTSFTIEMWVKVPSASSHGPLLQWGNLTGPGLGVGNNVNYYTDGNNLVLIVQSVAFFSTGAALGTGWRHIVITCSGSTWRAYLDGSQVWTASIAGGTSNANLYFFNDSGSTYHAGSWITAAAMYATPLSAGQVLAHYEAASEEPLPPEPEPSGVVVRTVSSSVTFAGVELEDVISARGQVSADGGWPTCSVFVTAKPATGNEENELSVVAGAGNNVTRFVGRVRRFRPSAFPRGIEIVAMGTLAYAAEWAPGEDRLFDETFPSGTTDENLVAWALTSVPGVTYLEENIEGTGIVLGTEAPEAFDWRAGVSAWAYIQALDQATLYRTYQQQDGTIRRVRMIGHPSGTTTNFTLAAEDILEGSTGERNTEQTRNAAIVRGHDYGDTLGPVLGAAYGANDFQGDGSLPATRHPELLSSDLIEDGNDEDGSPLGYGGLDAQDIADAVLDDVCKEFVQAQVRSWRDDTHGPGQTCLLDTLERLAIGEPMWVQAYAWEVSDGWSSTYTLSGGGLEGGYPDYAPPPV